MKVSTTYQEPLTFFRADVSPYQAQNFVQQEKQTLEQLGHRYQDTPDGADVLITNTHTNLARFEPAFLDQLKLVIHPNSGYDNFTVPQIEQLKCPFILGNRIRAKAVAGHALASLFDAIGMPPWQARWDHARSWPRRSLERMRVQLFGHGHIGQILHASLTPLVKEIFIYDPYKDLRQCHIDQADVIIFACSLNQHNQFFVDSKFLNQLPAHAILLNPARGKLIKFSDLKAWLKQNPGARAYLDVFEEEPCALENTPDNLKCTSHIAGVDDALDQRIIDFVCAVTHDFTQLSPGDFTHKWENAMLGRKIVDHQFI